MLNDVLDQDRQAELEHRLLVDATKTSLCELVGIAPRSAAEILVEVGDVQRFSEAGFARHTGTAPIPATSGEGAGQPVRHRLSRGGNRRLNATIHRMAMIQLRFEPRARALFENARNHAQSRREAMRILKRHLASVIYRTMLRDARANPRLTQELQGIKRLGFRNFENYCIPALLYAGKPNRRVLGSIVVR